VPELIDAWVGGYRAEAPLSPAEEAELGTFVLLRRLLLVAWLGSHPDADLARTLGAAFTTATCELAEAYLSKASLSTASLSKASLSKAYLPKQGP
jgi:Ser/Thr protein kinase RdoA (MazF antagonist)